ncbi:threonine ammonia-lyase [Roseiterribacter gracilis]|uniref:Serine/threonine dehydratase n=1 Tax=Roseiterribacter gracilis TaxID=2812848 RepID=A0A8S8X9X0_9PROT|nr:serine/threonine dehydratase [Rhodospirillales bacterium TMPK1]
MILETEASRVDRAAIADAERRLAGVVVRTPLLENEDLNALAGRRVYVKAESLQTTGSFKFRGAYNRLKALQEDGDRRPVVAWSSGNHAQAIAVAAKRLGIEATVVMPDDAPRVKIEATRAHGARVVHYDRRLDDREAIAREIAAGQNGVIVPSSDDPYVIAGQATVGCEIFMQSAEDPPSQILACCGGGGLAAGVAAIAACMSPPPDVYAVEPAGYDDLARSLRIGKRVPTATSKSSICDALLMQIPGELPFEILHRNGAYALTVSDDEVRFAMWIAFRHLRLVVEPSGAVALAALLGKNAPAGKGPVAVVVSGGNVDAGRYLESIQTDRARQVVS